jgi:hypothetical protein
MAEEHTGGMIALLPENPEQFVVPGGDPADQIHLTLVYLGDDVASWPNAVTEAMKSAASSLAQDFMGTEAQIFGHAVWNPDSEEFEPASVYELTDNGVLCGYAERAGEMARSVMGAMYPDQHVPYKPHITAGYNLDVTKLSLTGDVQFRTLRLALGGENFDYPLTMDYDRRYGAEGTEQMAAKIEVQPTPPEEDIPDKAPELSNGIPVTFPVVIVEGMETDDGRFIVPGALTHRALPLSILAQTANPDGGDGHDGAEVIGRLKTLTRHPGPEVINKETGEPFPEGSFVWSGTGELDPDAHGTKLAMRGYLTGNSADLAGVEAEFVWGEEAEDDGVKNGPKQIRMTAGKIAATTLVPIPAFAQSYILIDGQEAAPNEEALAASAAPAWRCAELGDDCFPCAAGLDVDPVVAAATPIGRNLPPAHAFADPVLDGPTALTLDEDSIPGFIEVYGHLATWGTCHTSFPNACITPPHSHEDYAYFNTGAVRVRDADRTYSVAAGRITMGEGGHASTALSAADAAAHYDNVNTVVADVTAGEDQFGIWVHGVMRKTVTQEQIDALRASPLSGDWRPFNGGPLELVAALAVNTGGFPVPRARVAAGVPVALVAAGVVRQPLAAGLIDLDAVADEVERRMAERTELAQRATAARVDMRLTNEDRMADAMSTLLNLDNRMLIAAWELAFEPDAVDVEYAKKPNWVKKAGGLPKYIKRIATHLQEKGMDESRAIATAVNAAKKMCSTGDVNFPGKQQVNPGSQAEACAAVADWEKKKAAS